MKSTRSIEKLIKSINTSDGAGVKLKRSIGTSGLKNFDPFLMLDEFHSEKGADYIAGFPSHPHRGFETVTYMLHGKMEHKDNHGNKGIIESGGVQWMTAGKGIIHSEMPKQEDGLMWGFQLWVNLPSHLKMTNPRYQDILEKDVPTVELSNGTKIRVVAGNMKDENENLIHGCIKDIYTQPLFLDIALQPNQEFSYSFENDSSRSFIYTFEGEISIDNTIIPSHHLGTLSDGSMVTLKSGNSNSRCLLIAALPLNEPIVQHGPFVMNTQDEIMQAFIDFQTGNF